MMTTATLASIQTGRSAPLGPDGIASGFVKSPVIGVIEVTLTGLAGDEQADLSVHGGLEKAVYAYPAAHHRAWATDYPDHAGRFIPGGVGENLTIEGWTEADLCVGDVHRIGTARLQVCQPRQPCATLALRFGDNRLPRAMVRNGRAGWYYRVIEQGRVRAGDAVELVDRPNPGFAFGRLVEIVNFHRASEAELRAMADMAGLAARLRAKARDRLGLPG